MENNKEIHMAANNGKDYRLEIELLKKDVSSITELHNKMESTVDKLETVAYDISKVVHEQEHRLKHQDHINKDMEEQLEKHIKESEERSKELNKKIECVDDKIDKVNSELTNKIQQSQTVIITEMLAGREQLRQELNKFGEGMNKKINEIDTWRYMVMGAIAFIVFIVGNISGISTILTKLFR